MKNGGLGKMAQFGGAFQRGGPVRPTRWRKPGVQTQGDGRGVQNSGV